MSREIKFRAWHKNNNKMRYDVTTDLLDRDYLEFMQYTGLKDKKGKEIYEGDIVDINGAIGEVKFCNDGTYRIYFKNSIPQLHLYIFDTKVIGNSHEDKELLNNIQ